MRNEIMPYALAIVLYLKGVAWRVNGKAEAWLSLGNFHFPHRTFCPDPSTSLLTIIIFLLCSLSIPDNDPPHLRSLISRVSYSHGIPSG